MDGRVAEAVGGPPRRNQCEQLAVAVSVEPDLAAILQRLPDQVTARIVAVFQRATERIGHAGQLALIRISEGQRPFFGAGPLSDLGQPTLAIVRADQSRQARHLRSADPALGVQRYLAGASCCAGQCQRAGGGLIDTGRDPTVDREFVGQFGQAERVAGIDEARRAFVSQCLRDSASRELALGPDRRLHAEARIAARCRLQHGAVDRSGLAFTAGSDHRFAPTAIRQRGASLLSAGWLILQQIVRASPQRRGQTDRVGGARFIPGQGLGAPDGVPILDQAPHVVIGHGAGVTFRIGDADQQPFRRICHPVTHRSRGGQGGQIALGIQRQGGTLAEWRDDGGRMAGRIPFDRSDQPVDIRDRDQRTFRVICKAIQNRLGQRIESPDMATLIEHIHFAAVARCDGNLAERRTGKGWGHFSYPPVIGVDDVKGTVGCYRGIEQAAKSSLTRWSAIPEIVVGVQPITDRSGNDAVGSNPPQSVLCCKVDGLIWTDGYPKRMVGVGLRSQYALTDFMRPSRSGNITEDAIGSDLQDSVVIRRADVDGTICARGDPARPVKSCLLSRDAIQTRCAAGSAGDSGDDAVAGDSSDTTVSFVYDVEAAVRSNSDILRSVQLSFCRWPAVAAMSGGTIAGNSRDNPLRVDAPNSVVSPVGKIETAIGS